MTTSIVYLFFLINRVTEKECFFMHTRRALQRDLLPWSPRHGFWRATCSPATRRCRLAPQPRPARAAVCGTFPGECWPAPPAGGSSRGARFSQYI